MAIFEDKKDSWSIASMWFYAYPQEGKPVVDFASLKGIVKVYVGTKVVFCGSTKPFDGSQYYHITLQFELSDRRS